MSYKLSPHSLSVMDECQRCFWQLQHEKIQRPSGPFPSLPSGMDSVLKRHYDSVRSSGELPLELMQLGEVKLFEDQAAITKWRRPQGLQWKDGEHTLCGGLDDLLVIKNQLIVMDYKTRGFAVKPDTASYYKAQLDTYNLLLRKEGHETAEYSVLLFYHPKLASDGRTVEFNITPVKVPVDEEKAAQRFRDAIRCLDAKKPTASKSCQYHNWTKETSKQLKKCA